LPIGFSSGSGRVGEKGPRRVGVKMCVENFGLPAGEAARDVEPDMVGESGYVVFWLWEKGFLCVAAEGDS
jgi:hypothetical protein